MPRTLTTIEFAKRLVYEPEVSAQVQILIRDGLDWFSYAQWLLRLGCVEFVWDSSRTSILGYKILDEEWFDDLVQWLMARDASWRMSGEAEPESNHPRRRG